MSELANGAIEVMQVTGTARGNVPFVVGAMHVPAVAAYARDWAADCQWSESDSGETPDEWLPLLSDATVIRSAARHYCGGIAALVCDALTAEPTFNGRS